MKNDMELKKEELKDLKNKLNEAEKELVTLKSKEIQNNQQIQ